MVHLEKLSRRVLKFSMISFNVEGYTKQVSNINIWIEGQLLNLDVTVVSRESKSQRNDAIENLEKDWSY